MERINQWLTLVANLAVIAGILFLAYEIEQNTDAVRSATYAAYADTLKSWLCCSGNHRLTKLRTAINWFCSLMQQSSSITLSRSISTIAQDLSMKTCFLPEWAAS